VAGAARHIAWPVKLNSAGQLQSNEQDSDEDIADCVAAICLYERGARRGSPQFGIPSGLFDYPNTGRVKSAIMANESRIEAEVSIDDPLLRKGIAQLEVGFDQRKGPA
jgi:hypothetical protein